MWAIPLRWRLLLIVTDAVFGALIGPLNFLGIYLIIGMLVADPGNLLRAPAALTAVTAGLLSTPSLFLALPALLATLLLAPPFVRLIERIEAGDPRNARLFSAVAGIGLGFVASFLTGLFNRFAVRRLSIQIPTPIEA